MQRRQQLRQLQAPGSMRTCICHASRGACNARDALAPAAMAIRAPPAAVLADAPVPTPGKPEVPSAAPLAGIWCSVRLLAPEGVCCASLLALDGSRTSLGPVRCSVQSNCIKSISKRCSRAIVWKRLLTGMSSTPKLPSKRYCWLQMLAVVRVQLLVMMTELKGHRRNSWNVLEQHI